MTVAVAAYHGLNSAASPSARTASIAERNGDKQRVCDK